MINIQTFCKRFIYKLIVCLVSTALLSPVIMANTEQEHSVLARIIKELGMLTPLIAEAEYYQPSHERVPFQYDTLRRDINNIKAGIQQKLDAKYHQPRIIKSIDGDYLSRR